MYTGQKRAVYPGARKQQAKHSARNKNIAKGVLSREKKHAWIAHTGVNNLTFEKIKIISRYAVVGRGVCYIRNVSRAISTMYGSPKECDNERV